ncbi:hypothetical protein [Sedimenticola selenatireducens]|uniref:Uncharacterized protein n=1 Tax=Sedimenticola selenatireducens TaxID=191960 RepID=A0A557RZB2_9GAMM|nr:hypothetical protein [Sedimenticola selenatireducens]TVO70506.1 hypothetical protein FHP88_16600 [Sedimenticola selenatireducens]TVT63083.1 MAG: hypothetical protein FHK78_12975 [Sedimenticola selenatireducens]
MAEDDLNEAPKEAEEITESAPVKKKAVRKRVPTTGTAVKKKVVAKKKVAPKKKAVRKRSITPKRTVVPAETVMAASTEATTSATVVAEEINQDISSDSMQVSEAIINTDDHVRDSASDAVEATPVAAAEDAQVITEHAPKRNENVQKRLEEMGLMPSDSTETPTPPPTKKGGKGLGFWQKSFIWTIVIVAGLLYIRNVANNGDSVQPEMATISQTKAVTADATDAEKQPITPDDKSTDMVEEKPVMPTSPIAAVSEMGKPEPQDRTTDKVSGTEDESPAVMAEQTTAVATEKPQDNTSSQTQVGEATPQQPVNEAPKEGLSFEQPKRLMDKLTAMMMGSDSSEPANAKEQDAQVVSETPNEAASTHQAAAVVSPTAIDSAQPAVPVAAESTPAISELPANAATDQGMNKAEQTNPIATDTAVAESGVSTLTETVPTEAPPVEEASKAPSQAMPFSSMPRNMVRMMPGYQTRPNPNQNRLGYPAPNAQPRIPNSLSQAQQGRRSAPTQYDFYRYRAPAYPLQFNPRPYYGPYPVRPPVYGPAVRYPYLQAPLPAPPVR